MMSGRYSNHSRNCGNRLQALHCLHFVMLIFGRSLLISLTIFSRPFLNILYYFFIQDFKRFLKDQRNRFCSILAEQHTKLILLLWSPITIFVIFVFFIGNICCFQQKPLTQPFWPKTFQF